MKNRFLDKLDRIKESEKGIALLFTLGILSLLLVLALAFATSAMVEKNAATNNANLASARMMAKSRMNILKTLLKFYDLDNVLYSHDFYSNPSFLEK